ncbi:ABC transporter permease [Aminivibrio sp.]|jgi:iron(III) transport system permease protein|uniref:ABC transporter permease n=1 Tax=Aminivibrio sp. TaxID=1872489 RepID=UPI0016A64769|nr:iron ABC transporter permease [Synergistaceae bacterium]
MNRPSALSTPEKVSPLKRDPALLPALAAIWISLAVFVLYPLFRLFLTTFMVEGQFSFANLGAVVTNWYDRQAFLNSLWLAATVSVSGTVLGYIYAFAVTRIAMPSWLKWLLAAITTLPLISPPFTSSIALTLSLGPNGILLKFFGIENFSFYGFWGTWMSETLTYFPVSFLTLSAVLSAIDPTLEDAGLSLGASPGRVFRTVTFPLSTPGIANSVLLLFASSLADFATPLVLAGHSFPVLPTQAYLQITGLYDLRGGASLSFLLLLPAMAVYVLQRFWVGKKSYVTISGKTGSRSNFKSKGMLAEGIVLGVCFFVTAFILYLYSLILWGALVKVWGVDNSMTLENFRYVFTHGRKAIIDTLSIAAVATPLGGLMAVVVGYIAQRKRFFGNRAMEFFSMLNYALPGTVVGIAYVIAFNERPILLTGTMAILVAAYMFRYHAAGIRAVIASLHQIDPSIEEASASLGAGAARTFFRITVPLVIPAVLMGMRYLFIHCMTAISATIFLVSVRWSLLTTRILECMTELQFAQACAFSVVLILLVFCATAVLTGLTRFAAGRISGQGGRS